MCHHIWRVRRWKDGGSQEDNAVHSQRLGGEQYFNTGDQGHGFSYESFA